METFDALVRYFLRLFSLQLDLLSSGVCRLSRLGYRSRFQVSKDSMQERPSYQCT